MSEETPGRAAYEAHMTASGLVPNWGDDEDYHAAWEAAAQAAIEAFAQQPAIVHVSTPLTEQDERELRAKITAAITTGKPTVLHEPAPELAAARDASDLEVASIIAERNQLRMALQRLADDGNLEARDRLAAIRPELTGTASRATPELAAAMAEAEEQAGEDARTIDDYRDALTAMQAERDELREALDGARAEMETARAVVAAQREQLAAVRQLCEHPEQVGHSSGSRIVNGEYLAARVLAILTDGPF